MRAPRSLDFKGTHLRIHKTKLGEEYASEDLNGSRYQDRVWRLRQGLSRSDVTAMASAGQQLAVFTGVDQVLHVVVDGTGTLRGFTNVLPLWDQGLVGLAGGLYAEA